MMDNNINDKLKSYLEVKQIQCEHVFDKLDKKTTQKSIRDNTKNKAGVYAIVNVVTGQLYVGCARFNKIYTRFYDHMFSTTRGNSRIREDLKKYHIKDFGFIILQFAPYSWFLHKNHDELQCMEGKWINSLKPTYNFTYEEKVMLWGESKRRNHIHNVNAKASKDAKDKIAAKKRDAKRKRRTNGYDYK